jgi:ABC-type nitrate/sulfonate/bicarbonate transport system substrate-binding protein
MRIRVLSFSVVFFSWLGLSVAPAKDRLRVSIASYDGTTEMVLAVTHGAGLFDKNGLKVELVAIAGAAPSTSAMVSGEVDVDVRAPVNAAVAILNGIDFTFLATAQNYLDYIIVTRPEIQRIADLKGRKVGIVRFGGKTDLLVRYLFRRQGLEPIKDFAMLQVGPSTARVSILQSGGIDATVLSPPQAYTALKAGLKAIDVPNAPFFQGAVIARKKFIQEERPTVQRFLRAYLEGIHFFLTRKEETLGILSRVYRANDRGWLEYVYRTQQQHQIGPKPYPDWEAVQATLDMMAADTPGVKKLKPKELFDLSLLEELDRAGFIDGLYKRK